MIETKTQLNQDILQTLGLDANKVTRHHEKIHQVLNGEREAHFPIVDACSVENTGILSWAALQEMISTLSASDLFKMETTSARRTWLHEHVVTCIPAAGVASRYWNGTDTKDTGEHSHFPKALLPATTEGDTFFDVKLMEQKHLLPTQSNVLIVPSGLRKTFENLNTGWLVLEQTEALSTIRFCLDGSPYCTEDQLYSAVPAGHGELLNLFDDILKTFPSTYGIHLRNIDNIIGTQKQTADELGLLGETFYLLRHALNTARVHVQKLIVNSDSANPHDPQFLSALAFLKTCSPDLVPKKDCVTQDDWKTMLEQLNKPLSVFGVVKKESGDQGGGPVFARMVDGNPIKICLEMTHASELDREIYFGEKGKLFYFNPVLVFFETQTDQGLKTDFQNLFDENFWVFSKKNYQNEQVCYHETVLYELIGNSNKTNLVFVEVPRSLFRPHKYASDSTGKTRKDYSL